MTDDQKKRLVELQHSLWFMNNNNDPESNGPSVGEVSDKLAQLVDILVGAPYNPFDNLIECPECGSLTGCCNHR